MRPEDRPLIQTEVRHRVTARYAGHELRDLLFETAYQEDRRLDEEADSSKAARRYWKTVLSRTVRGSESEQRALLHEIVQAYVEEITGNFDGRVYKLVTRVVPYGLGFLLNAVSPRTILQAFPRLPSHRRLVDRLSVSGQTGSLRGLVERGTIVLCPTHSSNLDSLVVGWMLFFLGLPPFAYGAGLNLFQSPLLSYFMHNLGAYKVDRKKKHNQLYLTILKEYCTRSLEMGYHNLFFPGGTRSRSGKVEQHIKLGLLGCGLSAYIHNLQNRVERPRVFVVPCTINYPIVLESATLILDFLKTAGKSKFIITDDEFSQPRTILTFLESILRLDSKIEVRFGEPLDPFGNRVQEDGQSIDNRGRVIDIERYLLKNGEVCHDAVRDREYCRDLGVTVADTYRRDTVVFSTHVASFAAFHRLREKNPGMDIYHLIRTGGRSEGFSSREICAEIARIQESLSRAELVLSEKVRNDTPEGVLDHALRAFASYHRPLPLSRVGTQVISENRALLYYYANRLSFLSGRGEAHR